MTQSPPSQPPATSPAGAPALPDRARRYARRKLKAGALAVLGFILARPRLDGFLRRQVFRFPGLAGRMRAAVARTRRTDWQVLPTLPTDEAELTDGARQILHDLRRALEHTRQP
ncbi:MAG: hypothetical protein JWP72_543 [Massilia sp.]|nr:hypothetical protein [Massilia sp.]